MNTPHHTSQTIATVAAQLAHTATAALTQLCTQNSNTPPLETLALLAWHTITEPGDALAHTLRTSHGNRASLDLILTAQPAEKLAAKLHTITPETPQPQLQKAIERWRTRLAATPLIHSLNTLLHTAARHHLTLLTPAHPNWAHSVTDLGKHTPCLLWVQGNPSLLQNTAIAVVGARAVSTYGADITAQFTTQLATAGATIISGGAYGVDAVAHRAALHAATPTIAVLAGGVTNYYPRSNHDLLKTISTTGALISEMPPTATPTRWRFLQRNRLIAALTTGTLVTEAGLRSGSLNTAGHAAQLGRALGAVPGNITSPGSQGTHKLLREYGAEIVCDATSCAEVFNLNTIPEPQQTPDRLTSIQTRIIDAIPFKKYATAAEIAAHACLTETETLAALAELELLQQVTQNPNSTVRQWRAA